MVFVDHLLNAVVGIAAGTGQIPMGVGEVIHVQFLPGLGEFQLLGQSPLLVFARGSEELGEAGNLGITIGNLFFRCRDSFPDGTDLRVGRCWLRSGFGKCCIEGQIDFVVRQTQCVAREALLVRACGERSQGFGGLELLDIYYGLPGAWDAAGTRTGAVASVSGYHQTHAHERQQGDKQDEKDALVNPHWRRRVPTDILIRNMWAGLSK